MSINADEATVPSKSLANPRRTRVDRLDQVFAESVEVNDPAAA